MRRLKTIALAAGKITKLASCGLRPFVGKA
jgi:hypothetical protein